jgi:MOSC domain-containing protein YiiM
MFQGQLIGIFTASRKGTDLESREQAEVVAGGGLDGDRYCRQAGKGKPDQEITLIEIEALEALGRESDIPLTPAQARRNLVTRGVPLNHLIDKEFSVGSVLLRGIRLCEPCGHLEGMTQKGVKDGLCHRGGLRAQVVTGGTIRVGDAVEVH